MIAKLKEAFFIGLAHLCFKHLEAKLDAEHEEHMQEVIDYIMARQAAGVEITVLAHPDMLEDRFALHSEPLPEAEISHLTILEGDEDA